MSTRGRFGVLALLALLLLAIVVALLLVLGADPDAPPDRPPPEPPAPASSPPRERDATPERAQRERAAPEASPPVAVPATAATDVEHVPIDEPELLPRIERTLHVTVLREDGGPARDAHVSIVSAWGNADWTPHDATTDVEGHVTLHVGGGAMFRVHAALDTWAGLGPRIKPEPGSTSEVTVQMSVARALTGHVVCDGRGVAGADVRLELPTPDDAFGVHVAAESGDEGAFALPAVPELFFAAGGARISTSCTGYAPSTVLPRPADLERGDITIELQRGLTVRGRFVAAGGAGVPAVAVQADGVSAASGSDGTFVLEGVAPGAREVLALPPAHAARTFAIPAGGVGDVDVGTVVLDDGLAIRGTVVDDAGAPLAGISVNAQSDTLGEFVRHTQTADDGTFALEHVDGGAHTLLVQEAYAPGHWSDARAATVPGIVAGAEGVRVVLGNGLSILVRFLRESDRTPIEATSAEVEVTREGVAGGQRNAWAGATMTSVRVKLEDEGTYRVTIRLPGYEEASVGGITVTRAAESVVEAIVREKRE